MATGSGYAGDVTSDQAMQRLRDDRSAVLVDVRTRAEWDNVGTPDLSSIGGDPVVLEWLSAPGMTQNPSFAADLAAELERRGVSAGTPLFFLCRSGARSAAAATAMTTRGYTNSHNIAGGFEGSAVLEGWRDHGLPWTRPGD